MHKLIPFALMLLANLGITGTAFADGSLAAEAEAAIAWHLGFGGGQPLEPRLGLTLGFRGTEVSRQLLDLGLSGAGASAHLAGLPLFEARYLSAQNDIDVDEVEDEAMAAAPAPKPWYAKPWVLWTAGGLAALALTGGAEIKYCGDCGSHDGGGEGQGANIASGNGNELCGTEGVDGVPDSCVERPSGCTPGGNVCMNCNDSEITQDCEGWTARPGALVLVEVRDIEPEWLSAGTGHMGDLFPR
jgi:hypothetical protein